MDIEQLIYQNDTTQMEDMLQMIDPEHGIILDDEIGLLGEFSEEGIKNQLFITNPKHDEILKHVGKLNDKYSMVRRGNYFRPIDVNGCILFDEYVKSTGIMYKDNRLLGHVFILKDYKASQAIDMFFDDEALCDAVVIYTNNKLYINNVTDNKLMKKFEYNPSIKIEFVKPNEYRLEFEKQIYYSYVIESNNNISIYRNKKMHL